MEVMAMEQLKLSDVRLRGCGFTLFPAANEMGVDEELMRSLVWAIYRNAGCSNNSWYTEEDMRLLERDPYMSMQLEEKDFDGDLELIEKCLANDLLHYEEKKNYTLTDKSLSILCAATKKQSELDADGFHFCPCNLHC